MKTVLSVKNLKTYYHSSQKIIPAVDGVSFDLHEGETIAFVGESGCGKSTLALSILNLVNQSYTEIPEGEILFQGKDLLKMSEEDIQHIRGDKISMIFQNPLTSLDPIFTVGQQIEEVFEFHRKDWSPEMRRSRAIELLKQVELPSPESHLDSYPHELSGGMQQRALIAIALACNPSVIIADEPTTALDVTIQAQILELISKLQDKFNIGLILITHDLGVVAQIAHRVCVMYGGVVVEEAETKDIFLNPKHPYTIGLLTSIQDLSSDSEELYCIPGTVPKFELPVAKCRFSDRCNKVMPCCYKQEPPLLELAPGHRTRCWLYKDKEAQIV